MTKRIVSVLMSFVLLLTLAACGGGNGDEDTSVTATEGQSVSQENSDVAVESEELIFGEFENFGNDPNNLMQSEYTFAFDDEHIYGINITTQDLYSMGYSGENYNVILKGAPGYRCNLNVYDGYLYYQIKNSLKPNSVTIERINLGTSQVEKVAEFSCEQGGMLKTFFQIIDGYLFYNSLDLLTKVMKTGAVDTATLNNYLLSEITVGSSVVDNSVCVTRYNGKVYMFIWPQGVYCLDFESFRSAPEQAQMQQLTEGTTLRGYDLIGLNGFRGMMKVTSDEYIGADYLFDDYQTDTKSFNSVNVKSPLFVKSQHDTEGMIEFTNLGYRVGESRVFVDLTSDKICYYKGSDYTAPQMINDGTKLYVSMSSGVYKDVLYIMCEDSASGTSVLVTVDSEGVFNQYAV